MNKLYSNFRGAQRVEVIRVEVNEGDGTKNDPITRVVYWMTKHGELIGFQGDRQKRNLRANTEGEK